MFVWYSKSTEESGTKIAEKLGCDHGTLPPKGYEGDVYCFGAAPSPQFRWEERKFGKIYNDPRKLADKKGEAALKKLGAAPPRNIRVFCSNGAVLRAVDTGSGVSMGLGAATKKLFENKTGFLSKLGNPAFVAFDGILLSDSTFRPTNVVYGPALTGEDDVVEAIAETVGGDAKEDLDKMVKAASPSEARAILAVLKKLGKE